MLMSSVFLSVLVLIYTFFILPDEKIWHYSFIVLAFIIIVDNLNTYYEGTLRSDIEFRSFSKIQYILLPITVLLLIFPYYFSIYGLLIRVVLLYAIKLLLLIKYSKAKTQNLFNKEVFIFLFKSGWKLWIWSSLKNIVKTIPRFILATFSGINLLGLFTPINWMNIAYTNISGSLVSYLYPSLTRRYARGNLNIGKEMVKMLYQLLIIFAPITVIGIILIPFCIPYILPKYASVTLPMQIALVASYFDLSAVATTIFAVIKHWNFMFIQVFFLIIIRILFIGGGYVIFNDKLLGISIGMTISAFLALVLTIVLLYKLELKEVIN